MNKIELIKINSRYLLQGGHKISEADIKMIYEHIKHIENSRDKKIPKVGDTVRVLNKHGDYYPKALIEKSYNDGSISICERAYTPFICKSENNGITLSVSGGAFFHTELKQLKYVGQEKRKFCDWGSCGACKDGAIDFYAVVNVWEYIEDTEYIKDGKRYSTKDYEKQYITRRDYKNLTTNDSYLIFASREGMPSSAWESEREFYKYKEIHKGVEFKGYANNTVLFTYKEKDYYITQEEWNKMDGFITTQLMNGTDVPIKIIYDDENKIMNIYRFTNYYNKEV